MSDTSKYALMWANGTPFSELFELHAHELAEQIRDHIGPDFPYETQPVRDMVAFGRSMADLIDPEEKL